MADLAAPRPSDGRRAALREADAGLGEMGVPIVSNFFPIERYYDAARKVLASFHVAYDDRRLDDAYVYGKRFASFSLDALPMHNYYKSPKYNKLRSQNSVDMTDVIVKLEQIAKWMDAEEIKIERERRKAMEEKKRREEAQEARRYKDFQDRVNQQKRPTGQTRGNVEKSALNKLEMLADSLPPVPATKPRGPRPLDGYDSGGEEATDTNKIHFEFDDRDPDVHRLKNPKAGISRGPNSNSKRSMYDASSRKSIESNESADSRSKTSQRAKNAAHENKTDRREDDEARRARRRNSGSGIEGRSRRTLVMEASGADDGRSREEYEREKARRRHRSRDDDDMVRTSNHRRNKSGDSINDIRTSSSVRRSSNGSWTEDPLPPPMPPPSDVGLPPPPSYNSVVSEKLRDPRQPAVATTNQSEPTYCNRDKERQKRSMRSMENVPMRKIREKYIANYKKLKEDQRIQVFGINTFQGRYSHSTNGCAVISPLVVSRHLKYAPSVPDDGIVDVIDSQCGPLLREIRGKLGLEGDALIIPSDVHDHLVDNKYLSQDGFIGVIGGNIMDPKPVAEFVKMLDQGDEKGSFKEKKTGATLFFHEHVVSIVKVPLGNGKFCFDLIDSMPGLVDKNNRRKATRTRCRDTAAFEALIRWYASSKFSDSNCNWIDKNDWDETMAEIDPRVFQGFVWGEAPGQ